MLVVVFLKYEEPKPFRAYYKASRRTIQSDWRSTLGCEVFQTLKGVNNVQVSGGIDFYLISAIGGREGEWRMS